MTPELPAEQQLLLDELYWNSTRTTKSIAEQLGLSPAALAKRVSPLPAGVDCWLCGTSIMLASRTHRKDSVAPGAWRGLHCQCGAKQPRVPDGARLQHSNATLLLPSVAVRVSNSDAGKILQDGIDALAHCGLRWNRLYLRIDVMDGPDATLRELQHLPEKCVVVPTLGKLAMNTGDALALFFRLVQDGWRVLTSAPLSSPYGYKQSEWYDELLPSWQQYGRSDESPW